MKKPRVQKMLSGVIFIIGFIALIDGYAEYASGEESLLRWLMLPTSQFMIAAALFMNARKLNEVSEADHA